MKDYFSSYDESARYYELIYSSKNYQNEVNQLFTLIERFKKSAGQDLLDIACGTGKHLEFLQTQFDCMGVDINESMLAIARIKLPNIDFKKGDMVNIRLNKKFDVITCLFYAIGYVKTIKNLEKTIINFASHLKPGGIVIIESWFTPENVESGTPWMNTYSDPEIKIARVSLHQIEENRSIFDFHYLIAERNKPIKSFRERHELGLFSTHQTLEILGKAGLEAHYLDINTMGDNRGLYIGVLPG